MTSVSYCTTCKGRLWQLEQTLTANLRTIRAQYDVDLVLLDYHSNDGMAEWVFENFIDDINSERLKYYRLTDDLFFDMSYAKNVVHKLATGDVLFNLDADNFIGSTLPELRELKSNQILVNHPTFTRENKAYGRYGRIGLHADAYRLLNGYDEAIAGMGMDDGDLILRALRKRMIPVYSKDQTIPINNTANDKIIHCDPKTKHYQGAPINDNANVSGFGVANTLRIWALSDIPR
jgi:Glycosyl transferase family 2.